VIVVAPVNILIHWQREFVKWLKVDRRPPMHAITDSTTPKKRIETINEWDAVGGTLIVGYETYRTIMMGPSNGKAVKSAKDAIAMADLVICDEGHRIKNANSGVSKALALCKAKRRICLTGYGARFPTEFCTRGSHWIPRMFA
jgi:transcriptional regulator ATRX